MKNLFAVAVVGVAFATVMGCHSDEHHHKNHHSLVPTGEGTAVAQGASPSRGGSVGIAPGGAAPLVRSTELSMPVNFVTAGAPLSVTSAPVPVSDVLAAPEKFAGQPIRIEGRVSSVCEKKGCWARLADDKTPRGQELFVKFDCPADESGRILPLTVQGNKATVEGTVTVVEISEAKARHYAMDGGMTSAEAEKIVGPQKQVTVASPAVRVEVPGQMPG